MTTQQAAESGHLVTAPLDTKPHADHEAKESRLVVTHALTAEGHDASEDGTGRGTPIIPILEAGKRQGTRNSSRDGIGVGEVGDPMYTLQAGAQHALAFDTTQLTSSENRSNPQPGDPSHPLASQAHPPAVAYRTNNTTANGHGISEVAHTLDQASANGQAVIGAMAVRRLTPTECERLQGYPDGWTEGFSDSVRYRMLGNSVAVPNVEWIAHRIVALSEFRQSGTIA